MNFAEAESYLFSLGNEVETMKLGLANITAILEALGKPHERYTKVQVAGTNGKGSVCAFLNSICLEAGIRTGMYTSPHLISIRERIRIDGTDISEKDFGRLATVVRETSDSFVTAKKLDRVPTFFEQVTAIALLAFAEAGVELAILETGLGGRFDATTAAKAEIAAITRIDLDHQEYLGDTIEQIAAEKAAIIHSDSKVVLLHQAPLVERVLVGRCSEVCVEPNWATSDVTVRTEPQHGYPLQMFNFRTERRVYAYIETAMFGVHQAENASVAIGVAELLEGDGFPLNEMSISLGLETAVHPGRLEFIGKYLLDGAHNRSGAVALKAFLDEFVDRNVTVVFGSMKDKNIPEIAEPIFQKADHVILTRPDNSRALSGGEIAELTAAQLEGRRVSITDNVAEAMKVADDAGVGQTILVTGSLYLVGEVRRMLLNEPK